MHIDGADSARVKHFALQRGPGPDPNQLALDMWGLPDSAWNVAVHNYLLQTLVDLQAADPMYSTLPSLESNLLMYMIRQKCKTLQKTWRIPRQRRKKNGEPETQAEAVERYTTQTLSADKAGRQRIRRYTVSIW